MPHGPLNSNKKRGFKIRKGVYEKASLSKCLACKQKVSSELRVSGNEQTDLTARQQDGVCGWKKKSKGREQESTYCLDTNFYSTRGTHAHPGDTHTDVLQLVCCAMKRY